jgi:hypothetical protein
MVSLSYIKRFALDTDSPTTAVVSSGNFKEFGCQLNIVEGILDELNTALTRIIFSPGITIQVIPLVTRVAGS